MLLAVRPTSFSLALYDSFSKHDLFEGGSFSPTIFNSDIELSVYYHISCYIAVCPFVGFVEGKIGPKCAHCFA